MTAVADAKECREHAKACVELANNAKDASMQAVYFDLAQNWIKLAVELERPWSYNEMVAPKPAK
jgi:hypothetical protein